MSEFTLKSVNLAEGFPKVNSMPELLIQAARKHAANGKTKYMIDPTTNTSFEYKDFERDSKNVAKNLLKRGFKLGDTLINLAYDIAHLPTLSTGVWLCHGIIRSSYPEDLAQTHKNRVEESRAGWLFCEISHAEMCLEIAKEFAWKIEVIVNGNFDGCISLNELYMDRSDIELLPPNNDLNAINAILCTSGTSGLPKGAVHTARTLLALIHNYHKISPMGEISLVISKGTHISGMMMPLSIIYNGVTGIFLAKLSKENLFKAVHEYRPSYVWGFPTFLMLLVIDPDAKNYDFSSIELVAGGGALITKQMQDTMKKLPNIKNFLVYYGLTEAVPLTTDANPSFTSFQDAKLEDVPDFSIGKVYPGVEIQIRHLETLTPLGPNERGEICIKSPSLFIEYFKNEVATKSSFIDGWFRTGDVGYYDDNEFIFIVNRAKEIFKYFNNHISPSDLESVLLSHPLVTEACVIGAGDPNGGGQIPRGFITLKTKIDDETKVANEILEFANANLPDYQKLRGGIFILKEFLKGKTGKVARDQLNAK